MRGIAYVLAAAVVCLVFSVSRAGAGAFQGTVTSQPYCVEFPDFCTGVEGGSGGSFTLTISGACANPGANAVFILQTLGDYADDGDEWFNVSIEGFNLGDFLDGNPDNDLFDNEAFGDHGSDCNDVFTVKAVIPQEILRNIVADGLIQVTFRSPEGHDIGDFCGAMGDLDDDLDGIEEFMTAHIRYWCPESVPTLSQWSMIVLSLIMVGSAVLFMRRRQRSASK